MKTLPLALMSLLLAAAPASFAAEPSDASYSGAQHADFEKTACHLNICVGAHVQVIAGRWAGHAGRVVALDPYRDVVTVLNASNLYLYPRFSEVRPIVGPVQCYWNLCVGNTVQIVAGFGAGQIGRVESLNPPTGSVGVVTNSGQRFFPNIANVRKVNPIPNPQCYAQICVGHRIRVITGRYAGFAGQVIAVAPTGVLTVRAPNGVVGYPTAFEVQRLP